MGWKRVAIEGTLAREECDSARKPYILNSFGLPVLQEFIPTESAFSNGQDLSSDTSKA
jgi:hypothetical protein